MRRTFGWIQDSGSFNNLKKVIQAIIPNSQLNNLLRNELIPKYVPERFKRRELLTAITGENCNAVPYNLLKGSGINKQLTVEENISMFGYSEEQASRIVQKGGRGNAACTGIFQLAIPAQKILPNGQNKPYQGDWPADCFLRWAVSLGLIDYNPQNDTCSVSEAGREFADAESGSEEEKNILSDSLLSYPPACRVLELLSEQGHLTKFEIGRQLGFVGEAGFTSVSQSLFVGGIFTALSSGDRNIIQQNFEGSSDKYARMIAGWLYQIGLVAKVPKEVTENYLGDTCTVIISQSYMITQKGQTLINRSRGGSRHRRSDKRVFWNMLATAAPDNNYLRNRRYYIIQAIKSTRKTIGQIRSYLLQNGIDVNEAVIYDDLTNFINIGLHIDIKDSGYLLSDKICCLELPDNTSVITQRADISIIKDTLRAKLHNVNHRYLDLLDLSYSSNSDRDFEIETMSLLIDELGFRGLHLGGGRRPDGIFYKNTNGVIVDTKAYSNGYNLPIKQADEMIRYIEENKSRGNINPNMWWKHFGDDVSSFSYLFISSEFRGHYKDNIQYIKNRTNYDGGVITSKNLLLFAEELLNGSLSYIDSFELLKCNDEVLMAD